jgi:WD40 repeat protein
VAFSSTGKLLVAAFNDGVCITDVSSGNEIAKFSGPKSWFTCAAFSCTDALVASGGEDGMVP